MTATLCNFLAAAGESFNYRRGDYDSSEYATEYPDPRVRDFLVNAEDRFAMFAMEEEEQIRSSWTTEEDRIENAARVTMLERVCGDSLDPPRWPAYAWPGGYPLIAVMDDGEELCADCVNDPRNPVHYSGSADGWRVDGYLGLETTSEPDYGSVYCAHCNRQLDGPYR
jgi:hypothetical protein